MYTPQPPEALIIALPSDIQVIGDVSTVTIKGLVGSSTIAVAVASQFVIRSVTTIV